MKAFRPLRAAKGHRRADPTFRQPGYIAAWAERKEKSLRSNLQQGAGKRTLRDIFQRNVAPQPHPARSRSYYMRAIRQLMNRFGANNRFGRNSLQKLTGSGSLRLCGTG